jgi:hypothetical protein
LPKELLTQFSGHANTIADTFRAAFAKHRVGGCKIDMTAPEGSTHGGLLALQHLTLLPAEGMNIVVGTVNAQEKRAELRGYDYVTRVYEERFKKPPPFARAEYEGFVEKSKPVLAAFGLAIVMADEAPDGPGPMRGGSVPVEGSRADTGGPTDDATSRSRWRLFLVISLVLLVGVALLMYLR